MSVLRFGGDKHLPIKYVLLGFESENSRPPFSSFSEPILVQIQTKEVDLCQWIGTCLEMCKDNQMDLNKDWLRKWWKWGTRIFYSLQQRSMLGLWPFRTSNPIYMHNRALDIKKYRLEGFLIWNSHEIMIRAGALQIGICNPPPLTFGKILKRNKRLRNKRWAKLRLFAVENFGVWGSKPLQKSLFPSVFGT